MNNIAHPPSFLARFKHPTRGWMPLGIAVAIVVGSMFAYYMSRPTVEVYRVQRGTAVSAIYGTVQIQWTYSVTVRAQNSGYIQLAPGISSGQTSIGTIVKKGQLLATIVDELAARDLNQAKIDLQAAIAKQQVGPASLGLLQTAQDTLSRLEKLATLNAVPDSQLEQARNDVKRYSDAVKAEKIQLDQNVDTAHQSFNLLENKLARAEIKSPIDGILTAVGANDGELVNNNDSVFTVSINNTYVSGEVNEEDVGEIHEKMKARVRLYSFAQEQFMATVTQILPYADPASQRYTVLLSLDHPPANLMAGMTGEMNVIVGERPNALLIPTRALVNNNKVFVVDGGIIKRRQVVVGYHSLQTSEILEGLRQGEKVIAGDQDLYSSGERVRTVVLNPDLSLK